ncbi:MAG: SIS domain-containing protein, partial [Pseudomonadales bacterium]|nr:SIS domain-containing protein [Pseudomonadales bacterium]
MCGIFGYIGKNKKDDAAKKVIEGLNRLSYRGYDSWGVVGVGATGLEIDKAVGIVPKTKPMSLDSFGVAIGHTRWATHGGVTKINAHPHLASDNSFALAQNGIVENFADLKKKLSKEFEFKTQTDTEVIVRQVEKKLQTEAELPEAIRTAFLELEGRNTVIVLADTGLVVAARNGSPLVVGRAKNGDMYFSSDTLSFAGEVEEVLVVENGQMVVFRGRDLELFDIQSGKPDKPSWEALTMVAEVADKAGYDHFMIKEIHESADVIAQVVAQDKKALSEFARTVDSASTVYTLGSGTAGIASAQIAFYLRKYAKVNTISLVGAEAQSYFDLFGPGDVIIAPSQSGETADVLEVLEHAQAKGATIATYVNMAGSMMTRMADYPFMAGAGPEFCVMSTKVFTSQIAWGYLLAKTVAGEYDQAITKLDETKKAMRAYLADPLTEKTLKKLAKKLLPVESIFLLGKSQ